MFNFNLTKVWLTTGKKDLHLDSPYPCQDREEFPRLILWVDTTSSAKVVGMAYGDMGGDKIIDGKPMGYLHPKKDNVVVENKNALEILLQGKGEKRMFN